MKKKILCVCALILFVLIACTMLSRKIETEMLVQVYASNIKTSTTAPKPELSPTVLFEDELGNHLYEVVEGVGWNSGLRINEFPAEDYTFPAATGGVTINDGRSKWCIVKSASRQPLSGELAEIVELTQEASDQYIVIYPDIVPEYENLPTQINLAIRNSSILLLSTQQGVQPYMEHYVKSQLSQLASDGWRVYSLADVEEFLQNMPWVVLLAVLLLIPVLLWIPSYFHVKKARENRTWLWINATVAVLALCAMSFSIGQIDLPSSMLPQGNILYIRHYVQELSTVIGALNTLDGAAFNTLALAESVRTQCTVISLAGLLFAAALITAQFILAYRRRRD